MNRTSIFLGVAALLALLALAVGMPRVGGVPQRIPHDPTVAPITVTPPNGASTGTLRVDARLSHPYVLPGTQDIFVTVDVTGTDLPGQSRRPVNLAVVIDRSGSMSGEKLQQARAAASHLVELLGPADRLSVVHYGSDVKVFPGLAATAENKRRMLDDIEGIWDEGGTNIGAALQAARDELLTQISSYQVNRAILITDGQPTEGLTDERELTSLVKQLRAQGISLSAIGVGTDFNEDLLQQFAELGSGSYGYLSNPTQLATLFQKDLQQASTTIARNVELSFQLPEGAELNEVLGYRFTQAGRAVRVPLPDFSASQLERVVARLTVHAGASGVRQPVTGLELTYNDLLKHAQGEETAQLVAVVTDSRDEVLGRQDKQAAVYVARAQGAANMEKAADALRQGDREHAKKLIEFNQQLFHATEALAGEAAVASDVAAQEEMLDGISNARSEEAISDQVKRTKVQALKSFGRLGSTY